MRRASLVLLLAVAAIALVPAAALLALHLALASDGGGAWIARIVGAASGGRVAIEGLRGETIARLRAARMTLSDAQGPWLDVAAAELVWSPRALLEGRLSLDALSAAQMRVLRAPAGDGGGSGAPPFDIALGAVRIARLDIAPAAGGGLPALTLSGNGGWTKTGARLGLDVRDAGRAADRVALAASVAGDAIETTLALDLGAGSWLAARLGIEDAPALQALQARARLTGHLAAARLDLKAQAGPARLAIDGVLDLAARRGEATMTIATAAMRPLPQVAWSALTLDVAISGGLVAPLLRGRARIEDAVLGPLASAAIEMTADGQRQAGGAARMAIAARFAAPRLAGAPPTLLAGGPLSVAIDLDLDDGPRQGARFEATHPLATIQGRATLAGRRLEADLETRIASLRAPLEAAGLVADGAAILRTAIAGPLEAPTASLVVELDGLSTGTPLDAVLGPAPRLEATLLPEPGRLGIPAFHLAGSTLEIDGTGLLAPDSVSADLDLRLSRLDALVPGIAGALRATARIAGPPAAPMARIALSGDTLRHGAIALEDLRAALSVATAPDAATAGVVLSARLGGAPLAVEAEGGIGGDGAWTLALTRADIAGLSGTGTARGRERGAETARLSVTTRDLAELGRATGVVLNGRGELVLDLAGNADAGTAQATLRLDDAALGGNHVRRIDLRATLAGAPDARRSARIELAAAGIAVGDQQATLDLAAEGPLDALRTRAALSAGAWRAAARATVIPRAGPRARLEAAEISHPDLALRLRQPATLAWRDGLAIDGLRLDIAGGGGLAIDGRLDAASSDLRLVLSRLPIGILARLDPRLAAEGSLDADARLTGPLADPGGRIALAATGLRAADGAARGLPQATLRASATRGRGPVTVEAEASLGDTGRLAVTGSVPLAAQQPLALRATGRLDLALADPFLAPAGRRARGLATLDTAIGGTRAAPSLSGRLALVDGLFADALLGLRLERASGSARLDGMSLRDIALSGRAGAGTIELAGRLDADPAAPQADLVVTLRDAQLLRSRLADIAATGRLALTGGPATALRLSGDLAIPRAEFRLAETLPPDLPVLAARETGPAPPRAARASAGAATARGPGAGLDLDLAITMQDTVFVRGRGLEAQLGGALQVRGDAAAPELRGETGLRRGSFDLLGQRLDFGHGRIVFDGGAAADPALDFEARREAQGITAIVGIAGRASAPVLSLTSEPALPADEILARVLFGRSVAETSPLELAQIAQGAAALFAGDTGGSLIDGVRQRLGLDQLRLSSRRGGEGMGVEAGRMLAPGVYLGVRPGRLPSSYEATLQVEIAPRLSVETDLGAAGRAGIAYEIDW
jgi:translocation and assembly module TamB